MSDPALQTLTVSPALRNRAVRTRQGQLLEVPEGWALLEPGDAGLTRRVKAAGPTWTVQEKRGRRTFSRGVWAPAETIASCREAITAQRSSPAFQKKAEADRKRRQRKHEEYAAEFEGEVRDFLGFHPRHQPLERRVAQAIAQHATPVGSGTVARTKRIPVEQRAEAATIAWLRHQTTAYDRLIIQRVKGRRREVRRELARQSRQLLGRYRRGEDVGDACLLEAALAELEPVRAVEAPVATEATAPPEAPTTEAPDPAPAAPVDRPSGPAPAASTSPTDRPAPDHDELDAQRRATQERILARFRR